VYGYKIGNSKFDRGSGKCLTMQIEVDGVRRVVFTGSVRLMGMLEQTQDSDFPFATVIKKEDKRFEFT
jgi:hypothetical protein